MSDYGGRLIRDTEPTVTTTSASGIWTVEEALKYKKAGTWPTPVYSEPNFKQTVLLLHGDGTNGAQNNTFLDGSTNNFTITRNGNTTQGTFSPFSLAAGEWSNYFDGSGDYFNVPDSDEWNLSNGDFTIEGWVYIESFGSDSTVAPIGQWSSSGRSWVVYLLSSTIQFSYSTNGSNTTNATGNTTNTLNTWMHFAITRTAGSIYIFKNGELLSTTSVGTTAFYNSSRVLHIGATQDGGYAPLKGYISNLRVVKGTAVYTSAFTPSTTPLTAISGTSLLTCQSNRFVDNSTNAFAITRNGDVKVTPFSPFAPTAAYSAGTNGGSNYFDGNGDELTFSHNTALSVGSSNFTIEFWIYPTSFDTYNRYVWFKRPAIEGRGIGIGFTQTTGTILLLAGDSNNINNWEVVITSSSGAPLNTWSHVAVTRSSSTWTVYLNGTSVGSATASLTVDDGSGTAYLGSSGASSNYIAGYVSNFRLVKGSVVYTGNFTPPTAPLTAITNTSLLCNFTNAGIFDNTGKNNLETVGNAQIDTTTKKYGTGSMKFDGTGDYLLLNGGENFVFGTGDFTIEFWIYFNATSGNPQIISFNPLSTNGAYPLIYIGASTTFTWYINNAAQITGTTVPSTNTWYYVAVCRSGTSTKLFVNGTQEGSTYTDSNNYLVGANRPVIGAAGFNLLAPLNGYIDDLRITKGVARYTANFTPPTAAFLDQ